MADAGEKWHAAIHSLGLKPYLTCADFSEDDSFRQVMARLGMIATRPRSLEHIAAGTIDDVRVLLANYKSANKIGHPSSSRGNDGYSFWTAVICELDPGLDAGFRAERETTFSSFFLGQDVQLGQPELDKAFRFQALDVHRLGALFAHRTPDDHVFIHKLIVAARRGLFLSDSMVGYKLEGYVSDAVTLKGTLLDLLHFRREIRERAARIPPTPYGTALRENWRAFAEHAGLAFDPVRTVISGVVRGVPIEVAQEGAPGRFQVAVRCRFPEPIPAQVRLTKPPPVPGGEPPGWLLAGVGFADIQVGDPPFDAMFRIQGYPVEPVRLAFQSPHFRAELLLVARVARHVELTHDGVSWFLPQPAQSAQELANHVEMAVRVARSREPEEPQGTGPYR